MVYLDVYNTIFEYLEETELIDNIIEYSEDILERILPESSSDEFNNEFLLEYALFNYRHENKMLIDFLSETLYPRLSTDNKKEFDSIKNSERFNLKFKKKISLNQKDTKGKELYDFYFEDIENNQTKIITSSTVLDKFTKDINARLINNPLYEGKYSAIGGISDVKTYKAVSQISSIKAATKRIEESKSTVNAILKFSKEHSLQEIEEYANKQSSFIEQDKKIMQINRQFFEKFSIGFDEFLGDFFELSNSQEKFIEMAEHYLSIEKDLDDTLMDTNYILDIQFLSADAIKSFLLVIKKDFQQLDKWITVLQNKGKEEFEIETENEINLSRENIIKNQKKYLKEEIASLNIEGFEEFFERIDKYSPENIKEFLEDIVDFLGDYIKENKNNHDDEIVFFTNFAESLIEGVDEIPYLKDVLEEQKDYEYKPEEFYDDLAENDEEHSLFIFLLAVNFIQKGQYDMTYNLVKENAPIKTDSFIQMFLFGKILSFLDDDEYKAYFGKAKSIDKIRYKIELEKFLAEKDDKKLTV